MNERDEREKILIEQMLSHWPLVYDLIIAETLERVGLPVSFAHFDDIDPLGIQPSSAPVDSRTLEVEMEYVDGKVARRLAKSWPETIAIDGYALHHDALIGAHRVKNRICIALDNGYAEYVIDDQLFDVKKNEIVAHRVYFKEPQ